MSWPGRFTFSKEKAKDTCWGLLKLSAWFFAICGMNFIVLILVLHEWVMYPEPIRFAFLFSMAFVSPVIFYLVGQWGPPAFQVLLLLAILASYPVGTRLRNVRGSRHFLLCYEYMTCLFCLWTLGYGVWLPIHGARDGAIWPLVLLLPWFLLRRQFSPLASVAHSTAVFLLTCIALSQYLIHILDAAPLEIFRWVTFGVVLTWLLLVAFSLLFGFLLSRIDPCPAGQSVASDQSPGATPWLSRARMSGVMEPISLGFAVSVVFCLSLAFSLLMDTRPEASYEFGSMIAFLPGYLPFSGGVGEITATELSQAGWMGLLVLACGIGVFVLNSVGRLGLIGVVLVGALAGIVWHQLGWMPPSHLFNGSLLYDASLGVVYALAIPAIAQLFGGRIRPVRISFGFTR